MNITPSPPTEMHCATRGVQAVCLKNYFVKKFKGSPCPCQKTICNQGAQSQVLINVTHHTKPDKAFTTIGGRMERHWWWALYGFQLFYGCVNFYFDNLFIREVLVFALPSAEAWSPCAQHPLEFCSTTCAIQQRSCLSKGWWVFFSQAFLLHTINRWEYMQMSLISTF